MGIKCKFEFIGFGYNCRLRKIRSSKNQSGIKPFCFTWNTKRNFRIQLFFNKRTEIRWIFNKNLRNSKVALRKSWGF